MSLPFLFEQPDFYPHQPPAKEKTVSPLKHSNNFAARMGRWSANHWKTAVFGWLAFVVAAFVIGNNVGVKYLADSETNVGEARTADKMIDAGFPEDAEKQGEIVLIQSDRYTAGDAAFRAVVVDVTRALGTFRQVSEVKTPFQPGNEDLVSKDRHAAMVQFSPKGTYDEAALYIEDIEAAVDEVQKRHDGFYVDELGSVSTEQGGRCSLQRDAHEGRDDRAAARAAHPPVRLRLGRCRGHPAPAGDHRSHGDERARSRSRASSCLSRSPSLTSSC